ncbi:MAG TPA: VWA domain-containing protein [Mycobacteriales bacterium]|nr:VWA domain-containing protein [Mycobacteriales bacterium]
MSDERVKRWRLALGGGDADGTGVNVSGDDAARDRAMAALYDTDRGGVGQGRERTGGLGASAPTVARWLGDIRTYFPTSVVRVMQQDAMDRLGLHQLLLEPEVLESVEPDVHLVSTLIALNHVMPEQTRTTARAVVRKVVDDLERRLAQRTIQAMIGALDRSARNTRPRLRELDWDRTIMANLKHYQPELRTVIPERLIGYGRKQHRVQRDVILAVDQSGSMASSVVYSSVFAAVLASVRALRTSLVVFDTAVVDLTDQLSDPVDVLFGTQLGGGTDINRAIAYCETLVQRPGDTILVLISDLFEGGDRAQLLKRIAGLAASGVQVVTLLALSDDGAPAYDHDNAAALAALGIPAFACTPDLFPELMAAAVERRDIAGWAARHGVAAARPGG